MPYLPRSKKGKRKLGRNLMAAERLGLGLRTTANSQYATENAAAYSSDIQSLRRRLKGNSGTYFLPPHGNVESDRRGERSGYKDYLLSANVRQINSSISLNRRLSAKRTQEASALIEKAKAASKDAKYTLNPLKTLKLLRSAVRNAEAAEIALREAQSYDSSSKELARLLKEARKNKIAAIRAAKNPKLPQ